MYDTITVEVEEKGAARTKFDNSVKADNPAIMAELDENATDSFTLQLGAIQSEHLVEVEFSFLMNLAIVPKRLPRRSITQDGPSELYHLHIPMVHKHRYVSGNDKSKEPNHNSNWSLPVKYKMYIKCNPRAKQINGTLSVKDENYGMNFCFIPKLSTYLSKS